MFQQGEEILHGKYDNKKLELYDLMTECVEYTQDLGYIGDI